MKERQLTIRLSEELAGELKALSLRSGLARAAIVRAALKDYLRRRGEDDETRPIDLVRDLLGGASLATEGRGETREEMVQRIRERNVRPT